MGRLDGRQVVETSLGGIGRRRFDVPLLEALSLLIAATYAFSNLLADLAYTALNPRIRYA